MTITLTREEAQQVLDDYDVAMNKIGGCSDGGCLIRKPKGMHTNGGCRCWKDMSPHNVQRMARAASKLSETLRARLSAPEPEPWQVIPNSVGTKHLTEMKAKSIIERDGRVVTGYVLDTNDSVCIVYHSAVRWYSNEEMFRVMHADAAPPQREWQGLTDEEIRQEYFSYPVIGNWGFARAIEAKLREKNT